jgi:hypothetical protein
MGTKKQENSIEEWPERKAKLFNLDMKGVGNYCSLRGIT